MCVNARLLCCYWISLLHIPSTQVDSWIKFEWKLTRLWTFLALIWQQMENLCMLNVSTSHHSSRLPFAAGSSKNIIECVMPPTVIILSLRKIKRRQKGLFCAWNLNFAVIRTYFGQNNIQSYFQHHEQSHNCKLVLEWCSNILPIKYLCSENSGHKLRAKLNVEPKSGKNISLHMRSDFAEKWCQLPLWKNCLENCEFFLKGPRSQSNYHPDIIYQFQLSYFQLDLLQKALYCRLFKTPNNLDVGKSSSKLLFKYCPQFLKHIIIVQKAAGVCNPSHVVYISLFLSCLKDDLWRKSLDQR